MTTLTRRAGARRAPMGRFASDLRSLLALALPIVAGLVCSALMGLVDSAVVAPLGHAALAAVSITASVMLVFIATLYGLMNATGVLAAQAFGAGDAAGVSSQRRAGWRLAMGAGLLAAALMGAAWPLLPVLGQPQDVLAAMPGYWAWSAATLVPLAVLFACKQLFDAIDRPGCALAVLAAAVPLNAAFSGWFVHGGLGLPALGLAGAGLGSFMANAAAAAGMALLAHKRADLRHWLHTPAPWRDAWRRQRTEGTPMGVQYLFETGANAVAGLMVGAFGAVALAANQITMSVTMALYMVPLGIASAAGLRIAQAVGAGERSACWPLARAALVVATAWMGTAGAALALCGSSVARAFSADDAVIATTAALCVAVALMQVADGVQSVSLGALRGLLDSRWPTRVSLACCWGLALPAAWALAHPLALGPAGVWWGFGIGLAVAAAALTLRLYQVTRGAAGASTVHPLEQVGRLTPADPVIE
ncbi:MAG: MATE family efflux transporter [Hydrogenophaga sp.]|uniref:MATE family efflux transporter n=1 Tax=Hydrogenophaga sp. TaxID=1904254 RepID=UPI00260E7560|nr:MATE family efflux transporter [Hydrogenophaga sp.]MCV0439584.1 MATE family efflux transporter [Hydrogenophaga sp.]